MRGSNEALPDPAPCGAEKEKATQEEGGAMSYRDSKYLEFRFVRDAGKTSVYSVDSRSQGVCLGLVKWYGPWRQYTFWPSEETTFNLGCLKDIESFLSALKEERQHSKGGNTMTARTRGAPAVAPSRSEH